MELHHVDFVVFVCPSKSLFIPSRPLYTRPASLLRGEKGAPALSRRLAWRPLSGPASFPETLSLLPGGKRFSAASPRLAPPPPGRVGCGQAASAVRGCPLWMVLLLPAVLRTLPAFQPLRWWVNFCWYCYHCSDTFLKLRPVLYFMCTFSATDMTIR